MQIKNIDVSRTNFLKINRIIQICQLSVSLLIVQNQDSSISSWRVVEAINRSPLRHQFRVGRCYEAIARDLVVWKRRGCSVGGGSKQRSRLEMQRNCRSNELARWSTRHGWAERVAAGPRKRKATGRRPASRGGDKKKEAATTTAASITRPDAHEIVPVLCTMAGEPLCRMARHFCYDQPIRRVIEFSFSTWPRKIGCRDTPGFDPPPWNRPIQRVSRPFLLLLFQTPARGSLILLSPNEHVDCCLPARFAFLRALLLVWRTGFLWLIFGRTTVELCIW